jgi:hypothetical protein
LKEGDRRLAAREIPPCFRIAPEPVPVFQWPDSQIPLRYRLTFDE